MAACSRLGLLLMYIVHVQCALSARYQTTHDGDPNTTHVMKDMTS